jgi:hypothetical protein
MTTSSNNRDNTPAIFQDVGLKLALLSTLALSGFGAYKLADVGMKVREASKRPAPQAAVLRRQSTEVDITFALSAIFAGSMLGSITKFTMQNRKDKRLGIDSNRLNSLAGNFNEATNSNPDNKITQEVSHFLEQREKNLLNQALFGLCGVGSSVAIFCAFEPVQNYLASTISNESPIAQIAHLATDQKVEVVTIASSFSLGLYAFGQALAATAGANIAGSKRGLIDSGRLRLYPPDNQLSLPLGLGEARQEK